MNKYKNLPTISTSINDAPYGFSYVNISANDTPGGTGGFCIMASAGTTGKLCVLFERRVVLDKKCSAWFRTSDGSGNWLPWVAL